MVMALVTDLRFFLFVLDLNLTVLCKLYSLSIVVEKCFEYFDQERFIISVANYFLHKFVTRYVGFVSSYVTFFHLKSHCIKTLCSINVHLKGLFKMFSEFF